MAFHVPFSQRNQASAEIPPVRIGFEPPMAQSVQFVSPVRHGGVHYIRPRRFSWLGFGGFFLCLLSCGILSPISLVMSLIGLRRGKNFFSIAGTIMSLGFMGVFALGMLADHAEKHRHQQMVADRAEHRALQESIRTTRETLADAANAISDVLPVEPVADTLGDPTDGQFTRGIEGNLIAVGFKDAWGQELRFDLSDDPRHSMVRSAGPDMQYETGDDLIERIEH